MMNHHGNAARKINSGETRCFRSAMRIVHPPVPLSLLQSHLEELPDGGRRDRVLEKVVERALQQALALRQERRLVLVEPAAENNNG